MINIRGANSTMRLSKRLAFLAFAGLTVSVHGFSQTDLGSVLEGPSVRLALIGDFGAGSEPPKGETAPCMQSEEGVKGGCKCHWLQEQVAQSLYQRHQVDAFDIGLTVGDNFYRNGVKNISDPHWECSWKRFYDRLGIVFYPTLGNHDYGKWYSPGSTEAQIQYSSYDKTWNMPAHYYTFRAGPVRFFALDTVKFREDQIAWLDKALSEHTDARWKVVYGHHPVYSCSDHRDEPKLIENLLPLLKRGGVDAYLSGHDHDLQYIKADEIHFFVSGGGGRNNNDRVAPDAGRCKSLAAKDGFKFGARAYGFLEVEANQEALRFKLIDQDGKTLWETVE